MSKLIIVGNSGVGKTVFVQRATTGEYETLYESTPGVMVQTFSHTHTQNGTKHKFKALVSTGESGDSCYTDGKFAIVMFALTSKRSFNSVRTHIREIRKVCGDIPIAVHANKCDIVEEKWEVSLADMATLVKEKDVKIWTTSSRSNRNMYKSLDWFISTME